MRLIGRKYNFYILIEVIVPKIVQTQTWKQEYGSAG